MSDQPPHQPPDDPFDQPPGGEPSGQFSQRIRHEQVSARVPEEISRGVFATGALVLNGPHEFIIDFLQSMSRPHQVVARIVLPTTIMHSMLRAMQKNFDNYEQRFGALPELPTMNAAQRGGDAGATGEAGSATEGHSPAGPTEAGGGPTPGGAGGVGGDAANAGGSGGAPDAVSNSPQQPTQPSAEGGEGAGPVQPPSVEEIYGQLKLPDEVAAGTYANTVMITHSPSEFCFDFIASFYPRSTVVARIFMSAAQAPRIHSTLQRSFEQFKQKVAEQRRRRQQGPDDLPPARD